MQIFKSSEPITPKNVKRLYANNTNHLVMFFQFKNSEWQRYRGFALTYQQIGIFMSLFDIHSQSITTFIYFYGFSRKSGENHNNQTFNNYSATTSTDMNRSSLNILIEVSKSMQTNETWILFRKLLSQSAHKFLISKNISTTEVYR